MRKVLLLAFISMLIGCGSAVRQSEFFQHNTVYKDLGHLWFSNVGYINIDADDVKKSRDQQWWGQTKYYPAAE